MLMGHAHIFYSVVFSPNGMLVASGSVDSTVKVWDSSTGVVQQTLWCYGSAELNM